MDLLLNLEQEVVQAAYLYNNCEAQSHHVRYHFEAAYGLPGSYVKRDVGASRTQLMHHSVAEPAAGVRGLVAVY